PVTETTSENIGEVRLIIDDDPRVTIEEIQEEAGLSYSTTQRIITGHLGLTKVTARYIPKKLNEFQQNEHVRICKENLARFRNGTLRLCNVVTGDESWIDHRYYIDNCLQPLIDEIKHQRPSYSTNHIILHHDNGKPHVHKCVSDYLQSEGIATIPHPPNSPDLSPCDFWLFDLIKRNLSDQSDPQSLQHAVTDFMY
ncbi:unnamed protein product, partial [Adineta ricciae]